MADHPTAPQQGSWRHSLSGRILLLTMLFVMTSVALIYFPTVARYHHQLLENRVRSAELAILPLTEVAREQFSERLRMEMLGRAGVQAVILRGGGQHELFLVGRQPPAIDAIYDADDSNLLHEIADVLRTSFAPVGRIIRIDAATELAPQKSDAVGTMIEVVAEEAPIRAALFAFSWRALALSLFISIITAGLVFLALYALVVRPLQRLTHAMVGFRGNPEDPAHILTPSGRRDEIGVAEHELATLQRELYGSLQQKTRLAALGAAVARIQHDLRNILSSAQIASDRLAAVDDPAGRGHVKRLMTALDRAIALASATLKYGRADERPPERARFPLQPLVADILAAGVPDDGAISVINAVPDDLMIDADREQLFRTLLNLVRNAREALETEPLRAGLIRVGAWREGANVVIEIADNGPGIPAKMRERLFQPFSGSGRSGGTGLGLAIARELANAHGGEIILSSTGAEGTSFRVSIPERM